MLRTAISVISVPLNTDFFCFFIPDFISGSINPEFESGQAIKTGMT